MVKKERKENKGQEVTRDQKEMLVPMVTQVRMVILVHQVMLGQRDSG